MTHRLWNKVVLALSILSVMVGFLVNVVIDPEKGITGHYRPMIAIIALYHDACVRIRAIALRYVEQSATMG